MAIADATVDLDGLRQRFLQEEPRFRKLRNEINQQTLEALRQRGLRDIATDARVKDVASFVKKILRKSYEDPWKQIRDKVGIRLTTPYASSIPKLEALVFESFVVHHYENKRLALEPNKLDYLGSHFEVTLKSDSTPDDIRDLIFEVQVHSSAESLWAGASHELLYKAPDEPPLPVARSIYRLLALVELFDLEVSRARKNLMELPGFPEARVLQELERQFFALTAHSYDARLSRMIVHALRPLLSEDELENYAVLLEDFVVKHAAKLRHIYEDYLLDNRNPLMSQPESLLIFERLESNFQRVPSVWLQSLPEQLLHSVADIWGTPVEID